MRLGFSRLVARNFHRSPLRAGMTVMTVAVMLAAFIFPRALVEAQEEHVRQTPNNRVNVRPKEGWTGTLPFGYVDQIRELPGVSRAYATRVPALRVPGASPSLPEPAVGAIGGLLPAIRAARVSPVEAMRA